MTIEGLLTRVGPGLMRALTRSPGLLDRPVTGICIHDGTVTPEALPGELLLAVGTVPTVEAVAPVLGQAADLGVAGVVLRALGAVHPDVVRCAEDRRVALLAVPATPWAHLATILRAAVVSGSPAAAEQNRPSLGDLFAFAADVAVSVGGAVTVEDPGGRVLAYSSIRADVDEPRKQTILGRVVPGPFLDLLQQRGVLQALRSTDDVVLTEPIPEVGLGPRWAIGIRAAGEFLGSLWVAESGGPLRGDYAEALQEAARTAALHLLYHRIELQADQTRTQEVLRDLLGGGRPADLLATSAGLQLEERHWVMALESRAALPARARLARVLSTYWATLGRRALVVEQGPRVYAVLPAAGPADSAGTAGLRFATDAARYARRITGLDMLASVASIAPAPSDMAAARREADSALRVLRAGMVERSVVAYADVRSQVTLLDLVDLVRDREDLRQGKVQALVDADRSHALVATLAAYLDCFGDVRAAAERLGIHPNTFRYRLRRLQDQVGLDLADPSERIVAALQLRALPRR
jgi:PucR-like helix-turn-helix protein/diguanylate cyclase with GGDEF domain